MFENIERIQTWVWTRKKGFMARHEGLRLCWVFCAGSSKQRKREEDDRANILFCANIYLSVIFCRSARLFCGTFSNGTFSDYHVFWSVCSTFNRLGAQSLVFKMCTWGKERRSGRNCLLPGSGGWLSKWGRGWAWGCRPRCPPLWCWPAWSPCTWRTKRLIKILSTELKNPT